MDASPMTSPAMFPMARVIRESREELRASWGWFVALGVLLIALGAGAVSCSFVASLATAMVLGYFLLAGGAIYIVGSFFTKGWGGFFLHLLAGVLYLAAGFIVVMHPVEALLIYTLLLAMFFFVEGLFRIVAALIGRFHHWGWMFANGLVTLLLGVLIWRQWPISGFYVLGLFLGINLILSGAALLNLGLSARKLPA